MQERVRSAGKPKSRTGKKRIALEIDAALAKSAAEIGVDLATMLEQALSERLHQLRAGKLTDAERENLKWAEQYVAEHGPWWDSSETA